MSLARYLANLLNSSGQVEAAKLAATLDLSSKTLTYPDNSVQSADIASLATSKLTGDIPAANATPGSVIQVVVDRDGTIVSSQSSTFFDGACNTTITPLFSNSLIVGMIKEPVTGDVDGDSQNYVEGEYRLLRNGTQIWISAVSNIQFTRGGQMRGADAGIFFTDSPGTTSPVTYKTQYRVTASPSSRNLLINGSTAATMILMEIAQ